LVASSTSVVPIQAPVVAERGLGDDDVHPQRGAGRELDVALVDEPAHGVEPFVGEEHERRHGTSGRADRTASYPRRSGP